MGEEQGVIVRAYEPNSSTYSRLKDAYFKAAEQIAKEATVRNLVLPKFYLFEDPACLGFVHPNLHTPIWVFSTNNKTDMDETVSKLQERVLYLFNTDATLDFGVSGSRGQKPLAEHDLPKPAFEIASSTSRVKNLVTFLETLAKTVPNITDQYALANSMEDNYVPMRVIRETRTPKKPKKK
jgi:hypothetical protein